MVHYFSRRTFVKATSGLLVEAVGGSLPLMNTLSTAHAQAPGYVEWMANVADDTPLSRLSIPGTHESCSLHGGPLSACQNRTLQQQLDAGIRFLDIRCRHISNVFTIHHGPIYQDINFGGGVRDVCIKFLKAHPKESIVMSIKEEYKATGNTRTFADTFNWYVQGLESFWYFASNLPTLKDVRGKIVLFSRFVGGVGIDPSPWQDNATFERKLVGVLYEIQDQYKVPTILDKDINAKWTAVQNLLDRAKGDTSDTWYINFTSGTSTGAYPNAVAARINPRLSGYVNSSISNKVGTLAMDFPDDDLIGRILSVNARPVPFNE